MNMKKLFIISSKSGRGRDKNFERELLKYFKEDEIKITEKPWGHNLFCRGL